VAKSVELRRHADADGDVLTPEGVRTAVEIGRRLEGAYDFLISSGAQRATQTLACFLTGMGRPVALEVLAVGSAGRLQPALLDARNTHRLLFADRA